MNELKINSDFQSLIPPISNEEYKLLEESICNDGCRDAIVTWKDTIVDGHNRYEICQKHSIGFKTLEKEFGSDDEARIWIIHNQLARRNLPLHERVRLALLLKPAIEEKAKEKEVEGGRKKGLMKSSKASKQPIHTRKEVATAAGVSEDTVRKSETIEKEASPEVKDAVRKGKMSVNKGYKKTKHKKSGKKEKFGKPKPTLQNRALRELQRWWNESNEETKTKFINWLKEKGENL